MPLPDHTPLIVKEIYDSVYLSKNGRRKLKIRTLISKFNLHRRTEENTSEITQILQEAGIILTPSIMKLGNDWELSFDDWVILSKASIEEVNATDSIDNSLPEDWNDDQWFNEIQNKNLRTEREVETKFLIPLLYKFGFSEDERYDSMPMHTYHGSKPSVIHVDCALFNHDYESLSNQVLLIVEAKHETRLQKEMELDNARKQAKSYAVWTGCYHCLVTDGRKIVVYKLARNHLENDTQLFSCYISELKDNFNRLYSIISKKALSNYYLKRHQLADEIPA
ncbi:type I restriction enzyme HsdR N-terminal domain-containing protein [Nodosilinea sp. FACHB-131]|uniref:type I restriction enzyme HsdR N-terminal domain-containing protein n=1 Tax=Cyanophyceae TaxID=3028117 RepID=UPI0016892319|nr:type I restriction enzyme HsdR N-terminal domain-containing protein [Nodosilinea sp. FACHB-131]MBD1876979.1 type I restriction enzyme HsdR N-terminal domain-containing protein [Nodosilinea sp. FACHB-131]